MEQDDQGWDFSAQFVCTRCVSDDALAAAIASEASVDQVCDFCGGSPAASLNVLLAAFFAGLRNEYGQADDEGVGWDGREGGYQWTTTWDAWDLIADFGDVLSGDGLLDAVQHLAHATTWVERNFSWRRRDEVLTEAWTTFCRTVKYETRYVIWLHEQTDMQEAEMAGEIPPARILHHIGDLLTRLGLGVRVLDAGYSVWRAQIHDDPGMTFDAGRLGTAPADKAKRPNRMSPAGIPLFYGAEEKDTAIQEVSGGSAGGYVTVGQFQTSRPCTVIDFTTLPAVPSMFDPELGSEWRYLSFLHRFAAEVSKPIDPADSHIDYVPTQILTEYFLRIFKAGKGADGILYDSATAPGTVCAAFDVPNDRCVEQVTGWDAGDDLRLGLVTGSLIMHKLPGSGSV